ncbi:hypothetical protein MNB_SV-13-1560 [hydrothermal vent metagenome]|uniref:Uncharacterized protein n=1 Tax=hydrothermal vent metagenome TaxID=652676 RepID=A0A1W1CPU0_9ZZZZ
MTLSESIPLGERLINPSAPADAIKNIFCALIKSLCAWLIFLNFTAILCLFIFVFKIIVAKLYI